MKKLTTLLSALSLVATMSQHTLSKNAYPQVAITSNSIEKLTIDGYVFRDLNKNKKLDPYEDWRLSAKKRTRDLLKKMTIQEKVGQIAHGNIFGNAPFGQQATGYNLDALENSILQQGITSYIPFTSLTVKEFAQQNNAAQKIAEKSRLGIPLTISTDPRHHFKSTLGASASGEGFSVWPETLGLAAINNPDLTRRFAEIVNQEYRAVGFNQALSPQADIASEPRWPRIYGTFGEDPEIISRMVSAYIEGIQGSKKGLQRGSSPAVVKHWVGYGAAKDGFDSHNYYGRFSNLTDDNLQNHIKPFIKSFEYGVSGVMPAYSVFNELKINNKPIEPVATAFNKDLLKNLLRKEYKFKGFVLSDWAVINDCNDNCKNGVPDGQRPSPQDVATPWGVMDLTEAQRIAKAIKAGVNQFGGLSTTQPILDALDQGLISKRDIDRSVKKILLKTFESGIFETPFVAIDNIDNLVNTEESAKLALNTQSQAITVLKRDKDGKLIKAGSKKLFLHNADANVFEKSGYIIVDKVEEAEVALIRLKTPFETLHPNYFFGSIQHEGSLAFKADSDTIKLLQTLKAQKNLQTIVDINLDRPAVLTNILPLADVLLANFGASDQALLNVINGTVKPIGKLPFELPSSMAAVENQNSGLSHDSIKPLFPIHFSAPLSEKKENKADAGPPPPPVAIAPSTLEFVPLRKAGLGNEQWEKFFGQTIIRNVEHPAIYPVLPTPEKNNGQAVLVVPGGGYQFVSFENEGVQVAKELAAEGYSAFVLKYRTHVTPTDPQAALIAMGKLFHSLGKTAAPEHPPAVDDLALAINTITDNAKRWKIKSDKVHVIGFSAGSRTTIRYLERGSKEAELNSVALIYPPMKNTIGPGPRPPLFMAISADDPLFIQGGMTMANEWWKETGKIEFHLYSAGGHGFGMSKTGTTSEAWIEQYLLWLETEKK